MGMLDNKAIVITGAGRGLGRGYALEAARQGASVLVNDIEGHLAGDVVAEITAGGGAAVAVESSVTTWEGAQSIIDGCVEAFGQLDGLVNNAGIIYATASADDQEGPIRRIVEVNLIGAMFMGTLAMRVMIDQGHGGAIVNNASSSQMGAPDLAAYSATKGALSTLTYCWAIDLQPHRIRVNAFSPSASTRMSTLSGNPISQQAPPVERNVPAVVYLLSDAAEGITGQVIQLNQTELHVVAHPALVSSADATAEQWTPEAVVERFDQVLRAHLQPVGWGPSLKS
jgi:NAD(P)-dependent dehydrogenase (short-subunit alcohol dehydrogenase family)